MRTRLGESLQALLGVEPPKPVADRTKFGFTKDGQNYTHNLPEPDAEGRTVWAVTPLPIPWRAFGRPARRYGEDGMLGNQFYPLRVLHSLKT